MAVQKLYATLDCAAAPAARLIRSLRPPQAIDMLC